MNIKLHGLPENRLKKCIFLTVEEFKKILESFKIESDVDLEGISYSKNNDGIEDDKVYAELSKYFGVEVSSVHCDDCDYMGVWIVYKEAEKTKSIECSYSGETVSYSISEDNTLTVFLGTREWFTVEDVKKDSAEDMISEVINDMGYIWLDDGRAIKKEGKS